MAAVAQTTDLPPRGQETMDVLSARQLVLRRGSSLALIAKSSMAIQTEFDGADPTRDSNKWTERLEGGDAGVFSLHYLLLENAAAEALAVLRCALDGFGAPLGGAAPRRRLIVDFVLTLKRARGQGLASLLLDAASRTARAHGANVLVLATEDSCVWWMKRGFELECAPALNARLNVFSDTHLLRHTANVADEGEVDDIARFADEVGDAEESSDDDGGAAGSGAAHDAAHDAEEENGRAADGDAGLQAALLASLSSASGAAAAASASGIAPSFAGSARSSSASSLGKRRRPSHDAVFVDDDDDPELAAAIALSLQPRNG